MERTELREQFFTEVNADPFTYAVTHHTANAWAMGYEQALRDHGLDEARLSKSYGDRVEAALEWLTDARRSSQAQAIIAFASLGKTILSGRPHA